MFPLIVVIVAPTPVIVRPLLVMVFPVEPSVVLPSEKIVAFGIPEVNVAIGDGPAPVENEATLPTAVTQCERVATQVDLLGSSLGHKRQRCPQSWGRWIDRRRSCW